MSKKGIANKIQEIAILRTLREFFSNSVKYSEARNLTVKLGYLPGELLFDATTTAKYFDIASAFIGSGIINMQSRTELIGTF